ncbi:D-alanyl-D-alanine carboxypeptidase [Bacillus sp. TS-2]|nr:D-alanyl-D-alanine carboxypeptidase [Bacillus sp. TS-2]
MLRSTSFIIEMIVGEIVMRNCKLGLLFLLVFVILIYPVKEVWASVPKDFSISAQAAILIEQSSGRVLYAKQEHEKLRIASITKIMTAILAIESGKMDEVVTVSDRAFGTEGSSIYLRVNEKIQLEDLVYGLMLRSGNDAAVAIAEHVGESVEGFVLLMNQKAEELGMNNTMFQNPHGLDDHEDHYSSAYDMALLTQYAMENEQYREISATKTYKVDSEEIRVFKNKNRMLTEFYPYSTGGKTGYTKRAKRTLVSTASKEEMDLIVVTINAPSDWYDHLHLFEWAYEHYQLETLVAKGKLKGVNDPFYKDQLFTKKEVTYPLSSDEKDQLRYEMTLVRGEENKEPENVNTSEPIGKLQFSVGEQVIEAVPLFLEPKEKVKKGFWSRWFGLFAYTLGVNRDD